MQRKSIFTILGVMLAVVVTSLALVFTVGPKVSADSEEIITVPENYLNIDSNGVLGDGTKRGALTAEGKNWIGGRKYRVEIPEGVTSIGYLAFWGDSGLTSITIPEGVTSIGENAFVDCYYLTSMNIPEGMTSIGGCAFYNCIRLTSIAIPKSLTSIAYDAFEKCSGLTSMTVDLNNTKYTSQDNEGHECNCIIEKSSNKLLLGCQNTIFPEGVTSIGKYAFCGCSGLTSITIPEGVTSIGVDAFYGCSGLTSIEIPSSVTSIDIYAFYGCSGLTTVTFAGNSQLTSIGGHAFDGCSGLTSITIPERVTSIGDKVFYDCSGLTSITIPERVTSIGNNVFFNCRGLTEIIVRNPDLMTNTNLLPYTSKLHYGAEQNTVTFNINGGTATSQTIDFGECATEPTFVGYHVSNWYLDKQHTKPFTFVTPIKYDITVYANWEINQYTVTFDSNEGSAVANQTVDYGTVINSPITTRTGYTFKGWLKDGVAYDFNNPITEDMNLIADWDINVYTVTFDACNGNTLVEQPVNYNEKAVRPIDPTKEHYSFAGWYTNANLTNEFDFSTPITGSLTLYAKWKEIPVQNNENDNENQNQENNQNNETANNEVASAEKKFNPLMAWIGGGIAAGLSVICGVAIVVAKKRRK